ncbi:MAG: FimB/Mfa2 family fimbrial subunit [Prevotella sp.]|nr:FimB/Mfa2 family fimbrial subunit [Prevotella sp.]
MKKNIHLIIFALMTIFLASCEKIDMTETESEGTTDSAVKSLSIRTRSADASALPYPITLYAFDSNGKCKAQTTITEGVNREEPSFSLPRGQYSITAMHVPSSYPAQASSMEKTSMINMPSSNYATEPLYLGTAEVNLTSNNQTADITLNLKQAKLCISLTEVPADVTSISVTIGAPYTKLSIAGDHSEQKDITIQCSKADNKWTTGTVYTLPSTGNAVNFTFKLNAKDGSQTTYSYTYNGALNAGTPYNFEGKYSPKNTPDEFALNSNINVGTWNATITKGFSFGPGASHENESMTVTEFPKDGDVWNGHVVALADMIDSNTCNIMLISLEEWTNVYSANNAEKYSDAEDKAREYTEKGITGWRIPSKDEAKQLKEVYGTESNFTFLNKQLESCNGAQLSLTDGSSNARYLCEDATYAFGFKSSSTISAAGATVKYHLRLIKTITAKKQ